MPYTKIVFYSYNAYATNRLKIYNIDLNLYYYNYILLIQQKLFSIVIL
jgi:hypothetical protein